MSPQKRKMAKKRAHRSGKEENDTGEPRLSAG